MKKIVKPNFREEKNLWDIGTAYVIGIDEVGRGAFAGPIVAAGVVFKPNFNHSFLQDINDSKLLKPRQREELSKQIISNALFLTIEAIDTSYIDKHGIGKANVAVFRKVLNKLIHRLKSDNFFVLIDGFHKRYLPGGIKRQKAIVKGDRKSLSIASASIIAKVYRDNLMREAAIDYPNYRFEQNKGYGTEIHRRAIKEFGISKIHRISFIS